MKDGTFEPGCKKSGPLNRGQAGWNRGIAPVPAAFIAAGTGVCISGRKPATVKSYQAVIKQLINS